MVQMTRFLSGRYLAEPTLVLNLGESASLGTGTAISTPLATDCFLNWPLALWGGHNTHETSGGWGSPVVAVTSLASHLDHDLHPAVGELLDDRLDPDERLHLGGERGKGSPPCPPLSPPGWARPPPGC